MNDCHRDYYIDSLIGLEVKLITVDNHEVKGKLMGYENGRYILSAIDHDFSFRKSHITQISKA